MKKVLTGVLGGVTALALAGYIYRAPLMEGAKEAITKNMFVGADTDNYDRGLAVGTTFPPINALHKGEVINDLAHFIADKGMIFIANRSVDW